VTDPSARDPLAELSAAGVSVWLDDLSRELLAGGELESPIAGRHVVGVTTNPTIFASALSKGDRYTDQLRQLAEAGASLDDAVFAITTTDVRSGCGVLRGVYDATGGVDGRVSIREDADIAKALIASAAQVHGAPDSLHADRGTSMTSKPVAQLLVDIGVARSHSRPHVSNDNPYSEAAFKTLKYAPAFPTNFGSLADARAFCEQFFTYYNHEHRHSGIGLHTPASVHYGTATQVRQQRQATLNSAYEAHPTRFDHRRPEPPRLPNAAWINQPSREALIHSN